MSYQPQQITAHAADSLSSHLEVARLSNDPRARKVRSTLLKVASELALVRPEGVTVMEVKEYLKEINELNPLSKAQCVEFGQWLESAFYKIHKGCKRVVTPGNPWQLVRVISACGDLIKLKHKTHCTLEELSAFVGKTGGQALGANKQGNLDLGL